MKWEALLLGGSGGTFPIEKFKLGLFKDSMSKVFAD